MTPNDPAQPRSPAAAPDATVDANAAQLLIGYLGDSDFMQVIGKYNTALGHCLMDRAMHANGLDPDADTDFMAQISHVSASVYESLLGLAVDEPEARTWMKHSLLSVQRLRDRVEMGESDRYSLPAVMATIYQAVQHAWPAVDMECPTDALLKVLDMNADAAPEPLPPVLADPDAENERQVNLAQTIVRSMGIGRLIKRGEGETAGSELSLAALGFLQNSIIEMTAQHDPYITKEQISGYALALAYASSFTTARYFARPATQRAGLEHSVETMMKDCIDLKYKVVPEIGPEGRATFATLFAERAGDAYGCDNETRDYLLAAAQRNFGLSERPLPATRPATPREDRNWN